MAEDLSRRENAGSGGRELEGQREIVQRLAELVDGLVGFGAGSGAEQLDGFGLGQRKHRVLHLSSHSKKLSARDKELQVGACLHQRS